MERKEFVRAGEISPARMKTRQTVWNSTRLNQKRAGGILPARKSELGAGTFLRVEFHPLEFMFRALLGCFTPAGLLSAAPPPSFSPSQNSLPLSLLRLRLIRTSPPRCAVASLLLRREDIRRDCESLDIQFVTTSLSGIQGSIKVMLHLLEASVSSALIDMYAKCSEVESAQSIFEEMPERNIVSWNTLITCYAQNGPADRALQLFSLMSNQDVRPDEVTLSSVVNACSCLSADREGAQLHALVIKSNFEDDMVLGNALVDMYAKCNRIGDARQDEWSASALLCKTQLRVLSENHRDQGKEVLRLCHARERERETYRHHGFHPGDSVDGVDAEDGGLGVPFDSVEQPNMVGNHDHQPDRHQNQI
ncbi:Pentatricopeptide repeat-containing protein [Nymphaea thermarum]|nr:Pentatricopeptide repeat-containing protein [Nymphaea thermarum]